MTYRGASFVLLGIAMLGACTEPYGPSYAYPDGYGYPSPFYGGGYRYYSPQPVYYPNRYGAWPTGGYHGSGPQITFAATFPSGRTYPRGQRVAFNHMEFA